MDTSKHIDRAEKEVGRRNYDLAISLYDQILSLDPNNGDARSGKRRAELKKFEKAYPSSLGTALKNLPHGFAAGPPSKHALRARLGSGSLAVLKLVHALKKRHV